MSLKGNPNAVKSPAAILWIAKKPHLNLTGGKACTLEDSPWFPNSQLVTRSIKHSTITPKERSVAIFQGQAGERRYAVEMFGHRTIQIASESSLVARVDRRLTGLVN
jgi:hypothetical protein